MSEGSLNALSFEGHEIAVGVNGALALEGLDYEALLRLKQRIEAEKKSILSQISDMRAREREGAVFDKTWHGRAKSALRLKASQVEQISLAMRKTRIEAGIDSFPRVFVEAAREVLTASDYARVMERVKEKRESRTAQAKGE